MTGVTNMLVAILRNLPIEFTALRTSSSQKEHLVKMILIDYLFRNALVLIAMSGTETRQTAKDPFLASRQETSVPRVLYDKPHGAQSIGLYNLRQLHLRASRLLIVLAR